ncbi:hypothetical protein D3C80_1737990 [compost metagenome]
MTAEVPWAQARFDTGICCRERPGDRDTVVCGGIVDDEDTHVRDVLAKDAFYASLQKATVIVVGDDDIDAAHGSTAAGTTVSGMEAGAGGFPTLRRRPAKASSVERISLTSG